MKEDCYGAFVPKGVHYSNYSLTNRMIGSIKIYVWGGYVHLWIQTKDLMRIMRHNRHTDPKVTMRYLRSLGLLVDTRLDDERRI
ncbi:hypothetical protein SD10_03040 [Spirosoma radiotolerans]|uniref:Uncharacterized protein n=1 Tax=Spirosoma radiotolerans TaxID=1379870 RepID=A0A0E3ZRY3_9BACT|nr:hypothetical protein SD10_03040 [Spirosoma radiotolerans]